MPAYQGNPFAAVEMMLPGKLAYSFGGPSAPQGQQISGNLTNTVLSANVATATLQIRAGDAPPKVGQLISTTGAQRIPNVSRAAITAVTGFNTGDNSTGTVSYADTAGNVGSAADSGMFIIELLETADAVSATGSGSALAVPASFKPNDPMTVAWEYETPTAITTFTINLQGSLRNIDAEFFTIDTGDQTKVNNLRMVANVKASFLRLNVSAITGSGTLIGKLLI